MVKFVERSLSRDEGVLKYTLSSSNLRGIIHVVLLPV